VFLTINSAGGHEAA
jgi:hypothetical protein